MLRVCHMFTKLPEDAVVVNVCSNSPASWSSRFSPFLLGPVDFGFARLRSLNVENGWQYSKVYKDFVADDGLPSSEYFVWARKGFANPQAIRFPMGKGAVPEYSWWAGEKLGYIDARKRIYGPLYLQALTRYAMEAVEKLFDLTQQHEVVWLRDWDGRVTEESFSEVLNNPQRKAGHAFFLKAWMDNDPVLEEISPWTTTN